MDLNNVMEHWLLFCYLVFYVFRIRYVNYLTSIWCISLLNIFVVDSIFSLGSNILCDGCMLKFYLLATYLLG